MPHPQHKPSTGLEQSEIEHYHDGSSADGYFYTYCGDPEAIPRSHQLQEAPMLDRSSNYSSQSSNTADSGGGEYYDVDHVENYNNYDEGSTYNYEEYSVTESFQDYGSGMDYSWDGALHLGLQQNQIYPSSHDSQGHRAGHSERHRRDSNSQAETGEYVCLIAGCKTKPFKRPADLHRHYKYKHETTHIDRIPCDYRKCVRNTEPFTRLDHCRDHYRDFHHEDLPRRGNDQRPEASNVNPKWWRCVKCLDRIIISQDGWQCPQCKKTCDNDRRRSRGYPVHR